MQPILVVVTGPPCTGKTTLARRICRRYGWSSLEKDLVKEALFDSLGSGDRAWSRQLSDASFAVLLAFARHAAANRVNAVIEGNFRVEHAAPLACLPREFSVRLVQINCVGEGSTLLARFADRGRRNLRHAGHLDAAALEELRPQLERGHAPELPLDGPLLQFDSTAPADAGSLAQILRVLDGMA